MGRGRFIRGLVTVWVLAIVATLIVPFAASAALKTQIDENGANDVPGQKDLTLQFQDTANLPTSMIVGWNWDETNFSGNNSGDGCALFDTNGNGKADFALCVSIGGSPASIQSGYPLLYTCTDQKVDRCTGQNAGTTSIASHCSVSITSDQPFTAGANTPKDTKATCTVVMSDFGTTTAALINSCSYPSAIPHSDPSDCVLIPRDAFLKVTKIASPNDTNTVFNFTLATNNNAPQAFASITNSGSSAFIPVASGVPLKLAETVPSGWTLTTISCDGGSPSVTKPSVTLTESSDQQVTCTFTDVQDNPSLTVKKEFVSNDDEDNSNSVTVGDTLHYKITATNNGNVTLTGVTVTDSLISSLTCTPTTPTSLAPNASVVCTGTHQVTQAEVNAGRVVNTGTADSDQTPPVTSQVIVPITRTPAIDLTKTGTIHLGTDGANPGDTITYDIVVKNTGNVTLDPVTVTDPKDAASLSCPATSLAPGASETCTASHTITQADIDAGSYSDTANASGTPPTGSDVTDSDTEIVSIPTTSTLTVEKSGVLNDGADGVAQPGETISYTIKVTNTGNVTLSNVTVTDTEVESISCPSATLAPSAFMNCTATHTLTQADIDAGKYDNTAHATGKTPSGTDVTGEGSTEVPIPAHPGISVNKTGSIDFGTNGVPDAGEIINYSITVVNTGNVTLDPVTVEDPSVSNLSCDKDALAPGASASCTASHTLTQGDIDAGHYSNTATGTGTEPNGDTVSDHDTFDQPLETHASIDVTKKGTFDAGANGVADVGEVISYTVTVKNTGNVSLHDVGATDPLITLSCLKTTLAPGESMDCTASYKVTQQDIDNGSVTNTATGTGTTPGGDDVTDTGTTTTPLPQGPHISVDKTGALSSGNNAPKAGDTISYVITVTNDGDVTLNPVIVDDPGVDAAPVCTATSLAPGATLTCTATHTLTQSDIDAGHYKNISTGTGTEPNGDKVTDTGTFDQPLSSSGAIDVTKVGTLVGDPKAGSTITFEITVTNTGNVTLDPVVVTDEGEGILDLSCPKAALAPGENEVCTASHVVTQGDVDAGKYENTATGTGTEPNGDKVSDDGSSSVPLQEGASISVDKSGVLASTGAPAKPGDKINYTIHVENTGNVTLDPVVVSDPLLGDTVSCPVTKLAPGASEDCTGSYALTQTDIDAGSVHNIATGTGTKPQGGTVSDTGEATVTIPASPHITVDKVGTLHQAGDTVKAGDTITYNVTVTNDGNVTLDPVVVTDTGDPITCPSEISPLDPGESQVCTASHVVTQGDIDAGSYSNTAEATGTPPHGDDVTGSDTETITFTTTASIAVDKTGSLDMGSDGKATPDDVISYTVTVTNTGNVTLTNITVSDPLVTNLVCDKDTLVPGDHATCTGTYAITQADIDRGFVDNTALGTGTPPTGDDVSDTGSAHVPITQNGGMQVGKAISSTVDRDHNGAISTGDDIVYGITVTNNGNVTLTGVTVSDPVPPQTTYSSCTDNCTPNGNPTVTSVTWTVPPVAPGDAKTVSFTVTVGKLTSCTICNIASATSNETGPQQSPQVCASLAATPDPSLAHASGNALAAKVFVNFLGINQTIAPTSSLQSGIGTDSHGNQVLGLTLPPGAGSVAKVNLLSTTSTSVVFPGATGANNTSTAETLGVNLLGGRITADVVRAIASATAAGNGAQISALGSTFKNLKVNGVVVNNVNPNTTINLPAALFGAGSKVVLLETSGGTVHPPASQTSGGTYAADLTVNMIHVYIKDLLVLVPGDQTAEIIVSGATAHADYPQTTVCVASGNRSVSGHALIADAQVSPNLLGVTVGLVSIPPSGGSAHQHLQAAAVPTDSSILTTAVADSDSTGFPTATNSKSVGYAQVADVCLLPMNGSCTVGATLIRSAATALADATGARSSAAGTKLLGLQVAGTPFDATPPPNTVITIPGVGVVILNEQVCDSGATLPSCAGSPHSGLTVRAVRLVITNPLLTQALGIGVQVIVAQAHADATWAS